MELTAEEQGIIDWTPENDGTWNSKDVGTREKMLTLRLILEDRIKKDKPTYMVFVEKAFDNDDWTKLSEILKVIGIR